jgi:glucose/arabinose dehydrogenase
MNFTPERFPDMTRFGKIFFLLVLVSAFGCSSVPADLTGGGGTGNSGSGSGNSTGGGVTTATPLVAFNPVGASFGSSDLLDLEFLPGQNGEAIVIGLGGTVYYMKSDFSPVAQTVTIPVATNLEQGLLNVVADPDYTNNHFIYLYRTVPGKTPDINQVLRYTVAADVNGGTFALNSCKPIIAFDKSESSSPGNNHNGGSLLFDLNGNLLIGVGDGGGAASTDKTEQISQNLNLRLGKIHRIIPDRNASAGTNCDDTSEEHFSIPASQQPGQTNNVSTTVPSIYAPGARNPFTMVLDQDGSLFFGDVGSGGAGASGDGAYEEIDCVYYAGENYGWPLYEGPSTPFPYRPPTWGYRQSDTTFADEDPEVNPMTGHAIMINAFYFGNAYGGAFNGMLIYSEFYQGWVRAAQPTNTDTVIQDQHIGHLEGLVNLQKNPVDGFLYGVSLGGPDQILKMELIP